jgi:hypothetical protein
MMKGMTVVKSQTSFLNEAANCCRCAFEPESV